MKQSIIWDKLYKSNLTWKLETRNLPKVMKGKKVLELGVGSGKTLKSILAQKPKEVTTLDFSEEALRLIQKDFQKVKTVNADVTKMPFKSEEFDVVVCYFILNNLLEKERKLAVQEIYRITKQKGVILFQDFAIGDFRESLSNKTKESHTIIKKSGIICHFFTEKEIKSLFSNFKSIKIKLNISKPITHKDLQRKIIFAQVKK